jgi:hypothetical protein
VENLSLELILARLKKERRRIDKAISALEKIRSAKYRKKGRGTPESKNQRSGARIGLHGRGDKTPAPRHDREEKAKVISFAAATRRAN